MARVQGIQGEWYGAGGSGGLPSQDTQAQLKELAFIRHWEATEAGMRYDEVWVLKRPTWQVDEEQTGGRQERDQLGVSAVSR